MRRCRRSLLALPLLLAVPAAAAGAAEEPAGRVSRREGVVHVVRAGVASPLGEGDPVFRGDGLRTGPASKVQIDCADGLVVVIGPATEVTVDEYLDEGGGGGLALALGLLAGIVRLARPLAGRAFRIDVRSQTAVASVRSTEWVVEAGPAGTGVLALAGRVEVAARAGGVVVLEAGFGTDVAQDQTPRLPRRWGEGRRADALRRTSLP
jgi:hypothetical protein